jgi:hypothetical protein
VSRRAWVAGFMLGGAFWLAIVLVLLAVVLLWP